MKIAYTSKFVRLYKKLPSTLQEEVEQKIDLFKKDPTMLLLKVHKLHGKLAGRYSFSVNYSYRIVFTYLSTEEALFHAIGDHSMYT